jgi:hypothetical protein
MSKSRIYLTLVGCDNANKVIPSKISNCPFSEQGLNTIKLKTDDNILHVGPSISKNLSIYKMNCFRSALLFEQYILFNLYVWFRNESSILNYISAYIAIVK